MFEYHTLGGFSDVGWLSLVLVANGKEVPIQVDTVSEDTAEDV